MKRLIIFLISVFIISTSACRYVVNNFDKIQVSDSYQVHKLIDKDFFILRLTESQVVTQDEHIYETPLRRYYQITNTDIDTSITIIEEVYIYLGDINKDVNEGPALYFVTYPFKEDIAKILYDNGEFISTYSIREILVGQWNIINPDSLIPGIEIELNKGSTTIKLIGNISPEKLSIEKTSHPKLDVHSPYENNEVMVNVKDIFFLGEEESLIYIRNLQNRKLIHPDWLELEKDRIVNTERLQKNHDQTLQNEIITGVILKEKSNNIFHSPLIFSISNNESRQGETLKYIKYNK